MATTTVLMVRHGQASFGKSDYDRLSPLGHRQAHVLGADLARRGITPDRIVCGDLRRQRETVAEICVGAGWDELQPDLDPDWNELDHQDVIGAYRPAYRHQMLLVADMVRTLRPRVAFEDMFTDAIARWAGGEHDQDYTETFTQFRDRVDSALDRVLSQEAPTTVVVTSVGCISRVASKLTSGGDLLAWKEYSLAAANTGVSRIHLERNGPRLASFNELSHLDSDDLVSRH
ncbi:histidine phosphatase family protein [Dermacoccaceae bacterium W4C1]